MADEETGRWRPLERGGAERNTEGIVAAQGRQDGGRHRPFSGPRAVSVAQVVSYQVLRSLFVVRAAW
jgi:hypothetical protein